MTSVSDAAASDLDALRETAQTTVRDLRARKPQLDDDSIDLILRDGAGLIFVEVKQARDFDRAAESLSARQMRRLYGAAEEYLGSQPAGSLTDVRFDVALVNGHGETRIIENAFGHG